MTQQWLIPIDDSDSALLPINWVINNLQAWRETPQLHLLNVQHEPVLYGEYVTGEIINQLQQSLQATASEILEWPADQLKAAGISYKVHTALGNVAAQVSEFADQLGCDTVVMGTRGLGSFTGMLLGSVATRVVHEVSVPVLLVK